MVGEAVSQPEHCTERYWSTNLRAGRVANISMPQASSSSSLHSCWSADNGTTRYFGATCSLAGVGVVCPRHQDDIEESGGSDVG